MSEQFFAVQPGKSDLPKILVLEARQAMILEKLLDQEIKYGVRFGEEWNAVEIKQDLIEIWEKL